MKLLKEVGGEFDDNWDAACHWVKQNRQMIQEMVPNCPTKQFDVSTLQCKGENYWEECKAGRQFEQLNLSCKDCSKGM